MTSNTTTTTKVAATTTTNLSVGVDGTTPSSLWYNPIRFYTHTHTEREREYKCNDVFHIFPATPSFQKDNLSQFTGEIINLRNGTYQMSCHRSERIPAKNVIKTEIMLNP